MLLAGEPDQQPTVLEGASDPGASGEMALTGPR
jgi:hypothetical protein